MTHPGNLTTNEVAAMSGLTFRQIDYWRRSGLFPRKNRSPGSGSRIEWDTGEARVCNVLGSFLSVVGSSPLNDLGELAGIAERHTDGLDGIVSAFQNPATVFVAVQLTIPSQC
jgi:hypothetical protein